MTRLAGDVSPSAHPPGGDISDGIPPKPSSLGETSGRAAARTDSDASGRNHADGNSMREGSTSPASPGRRGKCPTCQQPLVNCYCGRIVPQSTDARFVFLQHPAEARNPVGTARMAHLSIPGSRLFIGVDFTENAELRNLLEDADEAGVLFPTDDAVDLETIRESGKPPTIVVIDGTWSEARKIWKTNPFLQSMKAYRLQPAQPSRYRIRAEPAAHCVSTIEAVAAALSAVDGRDHESMLRPFLSMVDRQVAFSESPQRAPRHANRKPRRLSLPPGIAKDPSKALLVHVTADGYRQGRDRDRLQAATPEGDMVRISALRPSTGQRFSATFPLHQGQEAQAEGQTTERARRGWADFIRDDDAWMTWSAYSTELLAVHGFQARAADRVKHWCAGYLGRNPGNMENALAILSREGGRLHDGLPPASSSKPPQAPDNPPPPMVHGVRHQAEMERLEAIFRRLLDEALHGVPRSHSSKPPRA